MMKKIKIILFSFLAALLLSGCTLPFVKAKPASLKVDSLPPSTVYLDGEQLGNTPFEETGFTPGDYVLKLVPQSGEFPSWEKQIQLVSATLTSVEYQFSENEEKVSSQILSLEPIADKNKAALSISSIPDGVIVKVDGKTKGFSPLSLEDIGSGEHTITFSAPGFQEKQLKARATTGYQLILSVQLAKEEVKEASPSSESQEATPSATLELPYVTILDTPTGWLRVRSEPTTAKANEVAKVNPGEKYKLLEEKEDGWYKIEYEAGQEGWISGKYAEKFAE